MAVINYSVTKSGLEMQLLSLVINHEKPELEEKKIAILEKEESFKVQLSEIENQLLGELASSTGNLLENKKLIESLEEAKSKSLVICESLMNSKTINEYVLINTGLLTQNGLISSNFHWKGLTCSCC